MQNLLFKNKKDDPLALHFEQYYIPETDEPFLNLDEIDVFTSEVLDTNLDTFPIYYRPSAENDFIISCNYIAPEGEVDFIFPEEPCSDNINLLSVETGEIAWIEFGDIQVIDLEFADAYSGEINVLTLQEQNYGTFIRSEGPEAYWKLNETSGTQAIDFTENNIAATYSSTSLGISSSVGSYSSVYLNGTTSAITGSPTLSGTAITQEVWVRPDADGTITLYTAAAAGTQGITGQRYVIYPLHNEAGGGGGLSVGSNGIQVVSHGSAYLPILLSHAYSLPSDSFTHIVITWDNFVPYLFVNGQFIKAGLASRVPFVALGLPMGWSYGRYKGHLQDVAIYNRVLTPAEIREHYLAGIGLHFIPRMDDVIGYSGAIGIVDNLDFIQNTNLETITGYAGETWETDLSLNIHFEYLVGYSGETGNSDISTAPSFEILSNPFQVDSEYAYLWNGQDIITVGNMGNLPGSSGCLSYYLYPNYSTITEAIAAAPDGTLIFIAPGQYNEIFVTNKRLIFRGLGGSPTDTIIYSFGRPYGYNIPVRAIAGSRVLFENLTIQSLTSWEGSYGYQDANTKAIFNKVFFDHSGSSTHAIRGWVNGGLLSGSTTPNEFRYCYITRGYNHFFYVNRVDIGLYKTQFDQAINYYNSSGTLPPSADYVITPTEGYGYNYGEFIITNICSTDSFITGEGAFAELRTQDKISLSEIPTGEYSDSELTIFESTPIELRTYSRRIW